ncbi:hypothetical protein BJ875DRAFT_11843 [Amylocarpus encephaloides]|uniref:Uncharacterized protein n=1 Tax=Amylocarpus encephaloides TaxID=45428 RepID=A0A9P8C6V7_9HELO|nr:hypothetical protein BJ875DRAFT_11843 [Amylocarpus encephaloides]
MQFTTSAAFALTSLLALATASPLETRGVWPGVRGDYDHPNIMSLQIKNSTGSWYLNVKLNELTYCFPPGSGGAKICGANEIIPQKTMLFGKVKEEEVECRAYGDLDGFQPASKPFGVAAPAQITTPTDEELVGSILCYVKGKHFG